MNQEFKIPGYIETDSSQINSTPLQDGERLDFHMANEKLKSYAEIASRAATLSMEPETINSKNIFEREPLNHTEMIALSGLKTMKFRQEKAGITTHDMREVKLGSTASKGYDLAA